MRTGCQFATGSSVNASLVSDRLSKLYVHQSAQKLAEPLALPTHFVELLFLIEDKRFGLHRGVDPVAMVRATANNIGGGRLQGASTITQQLFDVLQLRSRTDYRRQRTFGRKIRQSAWAVYTEFHQTKNQILDTYLSNVYWGRDYFGLASAADGYFSSDAAALSVAQSFFLAERLANPNSFVASRVDSLLERPPISALLQGDNMSNTLLRELYAAWL